MKQVLLLVMGVSMFGLNALDAQGRFSGYMFGDYYYNVARDKNYASLSNAAIAGAAPGGTAMQAFQIRRVYFTYDNDISETFTTRFRLEADQGTDVINSGKIGVFVKDAYLKWKNVFSGSDFIFGIQPPPTYDVSEAAWGYRSLEKTIMDLRGIYGSRDVGVSLKGKLTDDGKVNYWAMIGKNAGNNPGTTSKYNRYSFQLQLKPVTNLQATLYADYKGAADIGDAYHAGKTIGNTAVNTAIFLGYGEPFVYNIGLEGFMQSTSNGVKDTAAHAYSAKTTLGVSVFGQYYLMPELSLVLRFDNFQPSTNSDSQDPAHVGASVAAANTARNYIIAALAWKVDRNVTVMPNFVYETYDKVKGASVSIDPSITARLTLYYIFL